MNTEKLFHKDFTLVVIGQIISLFGNAVLRFALPLHLLRETGSAALFGVVTACSFLPMIVLSFLGGVIADRVNKRDIMVVLDFSTAAIILLFTFCLGVAPLVPLFIVTLMLLYGISGAYQPAVQASIPVLASGENILRAGAVINQIASLAGLLGPILGGMLYAAFGITPILILGVVCFAASAIMEIFIHIPFQRRASEAGMLAIVKSDIGDSMRYIRTEKPAMLKLIVLVAAFNLILSALMIVGIPVIVVNTLQMSDRFLGFTQGAMALGGLCGGLLTALFGGKLKLQNAHLMLLLCSALVAAMGLPLLLPLSNMASCLVVAGLNFFSMVVSTAFSVRVLAVVQMQTPPELIGKVIALTISLSMCAQPVGQLMYGFLLEQAGGRAGVGLVVLAAGAVSSLLAVAARGVFHSFAREAQ